jgi:hypothetical protein
MYDLYTGERMAKEKFNAALREASHQRLVRQVQEAHRAAAGCSVWERAWHSVTRAFAPLLGRSERTAPGAC